MFGETNLQTALRRAKEALDYATQKETAARRELRLAEESRVSAKERYEALFLQEEDAEVTRRLRRLEQTR